MLMAESINNELFDEKYYKYADDLFRICMIYTGSRFDSEEIVQEVFIKLFCKAPDFENDRNERAWLIRTAVNLCKDKFRTFWHKNVVLLDDMRNCCYNEDELDCVDMIFSLPPKYRIVIHLYYYENYKVNEIAGLLKISPSAVKMRLKRGRDCLSLELGGDRHGQK